MEQGFKRLRLPRSGKSIARRVKLNSDRLDRPRITSPKEDLAWIVLGAGGAGGGCGKQLKCIFIYFSGMLLVTLACAYTLLGQNPEHLSH
jgi:hypothetical protein